MTLKSTNDLSTQNPPARQADEAQWIRIAEGLELLERMARAEMAPKRQDAIWNALGCSVLSRCTPKTPALSLQIVAFRKANYEPAATAAL